MRRESLNPISLQGSFVGWNRKVPHGIKIATFRDDGEFEEVFTSTTVRTRDTVFPLFGGAGTKPVTEAEKQKFGECLRERSDDIDGLGLRHPDGNLAHGQEIQDYKGREQPDPEELRRRTAGASANAAKARPTMMGGAASASAEPQRRISAKTSASSGEEQQRGGGNDPNREEPQVRRQRVARALCSCVPVTP